MTQEKTEDAIEEPPDPIIGHSQRFVDYVKWGCRLYAGRGINGKLPAYRIPFDRINFNPVTKEITYKKRTSHLEPVRRGRHKVNAYYASAWEVSLPIQDLTRLIKSVESTNLIPAQQ